MTATLHTFFVRDRHFNVSDPCAQTAVIAAEARVAELGPGKFVQTTRGTYVWQPAEPDFRTDDRGSIKTSELTWRAFNKTLSGSAVALGREGRYESLRVSSSHTGKVKTFTWSHEELVGGEVVAWVYRSEDGMRLRVTNN
jgi:hypothetical protein